MTTPGNHISLASKIKRTMGRPRIGNYRTQRIVLPDSVLNGIDEYRRLQSGTMSREAALVDLASQRLAQF
jgi:hypothetical protein